MTTVIRKGAGLRPVADAGRIRRRPPVVHTGGEAVNTRPTPRRVIEPGTVPKPVRRGRR